MSYPYPYHFGGNFGTPHTNHRDAVASAQGAVHVNLNIHPQQNYQYTPATNGPSRFYAEHHAGHGAAMQRDHQYYIDRVSHAPYPPLSEEMKSWNAFDPTHNEGMAGYGPPHPSTTRPARSANSYQNIDPALRRPESSVRSSYSLSDVRNDDWDCESLEGSLDTERTDAYSPPAIAGRASYAMPHSSITCVSESAAVSLQLPTPPGNSPQNAPASPAPAPAPEMDPAAIPPRLRRAHKPAGAPVPSIMTAKSDAVVMRRAMRARAAAPPVAPTAKPSSSSAKAKGKGRGKGKKRARADDSDAPVSSAKRSRHAEPEASSALEAISSIPPVESSPITPAENSPTAPEAEPFTAPDVASAAAEAATIERSSTPENRVRCLWDDCGKLIGKKADILGLHLQRAHLNKKPEEKVEHLENAKTAKNAEKGKKRKNMKNAEKLACAWDGGCGAEPMGKSSMERHVTATHLSLQAHTCPRCQAKLSHGDVIKRHLEKCCKCKKCGVQYKSVEELDDHACPGSDASSSGEN